MHLNKEAAAFGLFHLQYSALHETMVNAVLQLAKAAGDQKQQDKKRVRRSKFGASLCYLKKKVEKARASMSSVGNKGGQLPPELTNSQGALEKIEAVQEWRNARIHARVVFDPNARLVDDAGQPLVIQFRECVEQIKKAQEAMACLETDFRHIANVLRANRAKPGMDKKMQAWLRQVTGKAKPDAPKR